MKLVFSSSNIGEFSSMRNMLEAENIAFETRNETIPFPGAVFDPEIWIIKDEDFLRACELRDSLKEPTMQPRESWRCLGCGAENDGEFTSCVGCGAERRVGTKGTRLWEMSIAGIAGVAFAALAIKAFIRIVQAGLHSPEPNGFNSGPFAYKAFLVGIICGFACIWRAVSLWRRKS